MDSILISKRDRAEDYINVLRSDTEMYWELNNVVYSFETHLYGSSGLTFPIKTYMLSLATSTGDTCILVINEDYATAFIGAYFHIVKPVIERLLEVKEYYDVLTGGNIYLNFETLELAVNESNHYCMYKASDGSRHTRTDERENYVDFNEHEGLESLKVTYYQDGIPEKETYYMLLTDDENFIRITSVPRQKHSITLQ